MTEGRLLYKVPEAAAALGLSRAKLYQLMAKGELGSVRIASSRRIPATELHAFVERLREANKPTRSGALGHRLEVA